ncbi:MAG: undecaprenyldiphospho-muramoylpentapeptide beta-N-acetylglucosaminyltransferase [Anaerosomatales bacterium]|nr:undecaprenyldiphospho-muramoylpentapeptide beta-N-acetylglucosaminyltransferase [Anaerosomatales bacterium]
MAEAISADGRDEVVFVGTPEGLEARLVPEAGIRFLGVRSRGFDRSRPLTMLTGAVTVALSFVRALAIMRSEKPDVVLGFGGYVSLPVGFAAIATRTPLILAEQNSVPGLANRVLSRWARAVAVTYEGSARYLRRPERAVLTGNPVRQAILEADRDRGREALGLAPDALVVLVFGGSRGARHINEAMVALRERLQRHGRLQVVHVAGRIEAASVREALEATGGEDDSYRVFEYIDDMGSAIAAADVVVARAGATSIAEMTAIGRPAVLVPYPYATDDHQTLNARAVAVGGGAVVVPDAELDGPALGDAIERLIEAPALRAEMAEASAALGRRDAAQRLVALVRDAAGRDDD